MDYKRSFIQKVLPYAKSVEQQIGIPAEWVVAQWSHETGYGGNTGSKYNNLAGIYAYEGSPYGTSGKQYNSLEDFTKDYIKVITNDRYKNIFNANTPQEFADSLQKGGYATDKNYSKANTWVEASNIAREFSGLGIKPIDIPKGDKVIDINPIDDIFIHIKKFIVYIIMFLLVIFSLYMIFKSDNVIKISGGES